MNYKIQKWLDEHEIIKVGSMMLLILILAISEEHFKMLALSILVFILSFTISRMFYLKGSN